MIVAVAHACTWCKSQCRLAHCQTIGGKVFFRAQKNEKQLGAKRWQFLWGSLLSPLFSLSLSLSLSLFLFLSFSFSLSITLSLSLSQPLSLSLKGHTHTETLSSQRSSLWWADFASNCIRLDGWDSWSTVTVESTHCPPEAPEASPLPENWRHASRTTINQQQLEHDDDDRMQNCTETWTARNSSDTIPDTRDVLRPLSLTRGCWRFSRLW